MGRRPRMVNGASDADGTSLPGGTNGCWPARTFSAECVPPMRAAPAPGGENSPLRPCRRRKSQASRSHKSQLACLGVPMSPLASSSSSCSDAVPLQPVTAAIAHDRTTIPRATLADPWDRLTVATAAPLGVLASVGIKPFIGQGWLRRSGSSRRLDGDGPGVASGAETV